MRPLRNALGRSAAKHRPQDGRTRVRATHKSLRRHRAIDLSSRRISRGIRLQLRKSKASDEDVAKLHAVLSTELTFLLARNPPAALPRNVRLPYTHARPQERSGREGLAQVDATVHGAHYGTIEKPAALKSVPFTTFIVADVPPTMTARASVMVQATGK